MVYMAGDNNLSTAGDTDLGEMRQIGSTDDVNIIVEFDNAGNRGTNRYHIQGAGVNDCVQSLGETDSGDPEVLLDFVDWTARNYPAERYALVLWNHGCGWQPLEMDKIAREMRAVDYSEREASERSASPLGRVFFRTTLEKIFSIPSSSERAICSDDGTGHSLDTIELGNVLMRAVATLGQSIDLLGMDACLMSNLEVAYQAKPYVNYIVGSEENEPADGWPYHDVLKELVADPTMTTADLAAQIVDLYLKSYQGYSGDVTQAALDVEKVMVLVKPMDRLATILKEHMSESQMLIWKAQRKSAAFWHFTLWDITHFLKELAKQVKENVADTHLKTELAKVAVQLEAALKVGPSHFVLAEGHQGAKVAQCGGVTIYLPSTPTISPYYTDLEFAKQHRWPALLKAYLDT